MDIVVKKSFKLCQEFVCSFPRTARQNTKTGWPQSPGICCLRVELDVWDQVSAESSPSKVPRGQSVFASPAAAAQSLQSCPTLCDPMDCSPAGSSVHGISQARVLEWVAIYFSRGSSQPRDPTQVSCIAGRFFTAEPPGKPICWYNMSLIFGVPWLWKWVTIHSSWMTIFSHYIHIVFPLVHVYFCVQIFSFEKFTSWVVLGLTPLIPF